MKLCHLLLSSACLVGALAPTCQAKSIASFTSSLTSSSPTELGRPSRSGVAQDWSGSETYSGVVNPTTPYQYQTYTFAASLFTGAPYVEITFFNITNSPYLFATAYANNYSLLNRGTNWLGDEGTSGNVTVNDGRFFDVILPSNSSLVLVVNNTLTGRLNDPFLVTVDAFADTMYTDPSPAPVPEPSTLLTLGTGLLGLINPVRRKLFSLAS